MYIHRYVCSFKINRKPTVTLTLFCLYRFATCNIQTARETGLKVKKKGREMENFKKFASGKSGALEWRELRRKREEKEGAGRSAYTARRDCCCDAAADRAPK